MNKKSLTGRGLWLRSSHRKQAGFASNQRSLVSPQAIVTLALFLLVLAPSILADTTPPAYSNFAKNITDIRIVTDSAVEFNITIIDAANSVLYWNFSWNCTEDNTWVNVTNSTDLTDPSQSNNSIESIAVGEVCGYMFCSSDDQGNVGCDSVRTFVIKIGLVAQAFDVLVCPSTTAGMMFLMLIVVISLFFIFIALMFNIGIIGVFGSIMLMVTSWYQSPCIHIFAYILTLFSLFLLIWFALFGLGFVNKTFE